MTKHYGHSTGPCSAELRSCAAGEVGGALPCGSQTAHLNQCFTSLEGTTTQLACGKQRLQVSVELFSGGRRQLDVCRLQPAAQLQVGRDGHPSRWVVWRAGTSNARHVLSLQQATSFVGSWKSKAVPTVPGNKRKCAGA